MDDMALSKKVSFLSFVAMVAVVVIHCNTIGTLPEPSRWNLFFQTVFSRMGTAWAVPFFFAVSGFWANRSLRDRISVGGGKVLFCRSERRPRGFWCRISCGRQSVR